MNLPRRPADALGPAAPSRDRQGQVSLSAELADAAVDEAARERRTRRSVSDRLTEELTFSAVARGLGERNETVSLGTTHGRRHHGRITGVGADALRLEGPAGASVIVWSAVAWLKSSGPADSGSGGMGAAATHLVDVFEELRAAACPVMVSCGASSPVEGVIVGVGSDVGVLRLSESTSIIHLNLAAVSELAWAAR